MAQGLKERTLLANFFPSNGSSRIDFFALPSTKQNPLVQLVFHAEGQKDIEMMTLTQAEIATLIVALKHVCLV